MNKDIKTLKETIDEIIHNVTVLIQMTDNLNTATDNQNKINTITKGYLDIIHDDIDVLNEGIEALTIAQGDILNRLDEIEYRLNKMAFIEEDNDYEY